MNHRLPDESEVMRDGGQAGQLNRGASAPIADAALPLLPLYCLTPTSIAARHHSPPTAP